jgi:hypothetical protein
MLTPLPNALRSFTPPQRVVYDTPAFGSCTTPNAMRSAITKPLHTCSVHPTSMTTPYVPCIATDATVPRPHSTTHGRRRPRSSAARSDDLRRSHHPPARTVTRMCDATAVRSARCVHSPAHTRDNHLRCSPALLDVCPPRAAPPVMCTTIHMRSARGGRYSSPHHALYYLRSTTTDTSPLSSTQEHPHAPGVLPVQTGSHTRDASDIRSHENAIVAHPGSLPAAQLHGYPPCGTSHRLSSASPVPASLERGARHPLRCTARLRRTAPTRSTPSY